MSGTTPSAGVVDPGEASFDPAVSELVEQTATTNTFANADRSMTTVLSTDPMNVAVDGEWADVQTTLSGDGTGQWVVENNPLGPTFAKFADDEQLLSVEQDGFAVSFSLRGRRTVS